MHKITSSNGLKTVLCDDGLTQSMVCVKVQKLAKAFVSELIAMALHHEVPDAILNCLAYRLTEEFEEGSLTEMRMSKVTEALTDVNRDKEFFNIKSYHRNPQPTSYERKRYKKNTQERRAEDYTGECDHNLKPNHRQRWRGERHRGTQGYERLVLRRRRLGRDIKEGAGPHRFPTQVGATEGTAAKSGNSTSLCIWGHQCAEFTMSDFYRCSGRLNIRARRAG